MVLAALLSTKGELRRASVMTREILMSKRLAMDVYDCLVTVATELVRGGMPDQAAELVQVFQTNYNSVFGAAELVDAVTHTQLGYFNPVRWLEKKLATADGNPPHNHKSNQK